MFTRRLIVYKIEQVVGSYPLSIYLYLLISDTLRCVVEVSEAERGRFIRLKHIRNMHEYIITFVHIKNRKDKKIKCSF